MPRRLPAGFWEQKIVLSCVVSQEGVWSETHFFNKQMLVVSLLAGGENVSSRN